MASRLQRAARIEADGTDGFDAADRPAERLSSPGSGGPAYPIESVDNVLRLLLLLGQRGQIRVSEASVELGTAVSTAHRLLAMLSHHGFVRQDPASKVYAAGPVLVRLGLKAVQSLDLRTLAHEHLVRLRDETGETVHLAVPEGNQVSFIDAVESEKALRVSSRRGVTMWAHCTSVGKAYLAHLEDSRLLELYPSIDLPSMTRHSVTSRSRLFAELARIRAEGYAESSGESEDGVGSAGVAVHDRAGRVVAAVSSSVPLSRLTPLLRGGIVAATRRAAAEIAAVLP